MKATIPVRTVFDHKGNIIRREYKDVIFSPEQVRSMCALLAKQLEHDRVQDKVLTQVSAP